MQRHSKVQFTQTVYEYVQHKLTTGPYPSCTPYLCIISQQQLFGVSGPVPSSLFLPSCAQLPRCRQCCPAWNNKMSFSIPIILWSSCYGLSCNVGCPERDANIPIAFFLFQFQWILALFVAIILHYCWFLASESWGCVLHVSDPYWWSYFTFYLKILVWVAIALALHMCLSWRKTKKAALVLSILAFASVPVPKWLFTMLPRYVKASTPPSPFPPIMTGSSLAMCIL